MPAVTPSAPSSSSASSVSSRSSVRVQRAYSGQSTTPWWLVAVRSVVTRTGSPGASQTVAWSRVTIDEGHVVCGLHRDPLQRRDTLRDRRARLEQVADDDRDAEAAPGAAPTAEGERHREPAVVDAVEQPPQLVGHADHPRAGESGLQHDGVEQVGVVVVVAHQRRLPGQRGLRAPAQQRRRVNAAAGPDRACKGVGNIASTEILTRGSYVSRERSGFPRAHSALRP